MKPGIDPRPEPAPRVDSFSSPAKGILLTPGTTATRRKTVSFGGIGTKAESLKAQDLNDRVAMNKTSCAELLDDTTADVRRSLFESKIKAEDTPAQDDTHDAQNEPPIEQSPKKEANSSTKRDLNSYESDVTVDLRSPRSKSGQHWKREYQRDHDKSKREMRKLIRYSQDTKSYAVKRDGEALRLAEKLRSAEITVQEMENRVSELASQLMNVQTQGEKQAEILDELATQTAQALRYKQKADKYRLALLNQVPKDSAGLRQPHSVLDAAGKDQSELTSLRTEVSNLQTASQKAEERALELERENSALKHTLARVKEEMKRYETRHRTQADARKRKDEKSAAQKKILREQLTNVKTENERLINEAKLHSTQDKSFVTQGPTIGKQNSELRQASSREDYATLQEARPGSKRHYNVAASTNAANLGLDLDGPVKGVGNTQHSTQLLNRAKKERHYQPRESSHLSQRTTQKSTDNRLPYSLQEGIDFQVPLADASYGRRQPQLDLDSSRILGTINQNSSPNFHGRHEEVKTPLVDGGVRLNLPIAGQRDGPLFLSSRTGSMAGRTPLPPDRAAAAKKRIEEKSAERKRSREHGKENRKPVL